MLEVFPQTQIVYPGDVHRFTLRGQPPPHYWYLLTNGTIQSDGALQMTTTTSGSLMRGYGAHHLLSGIGRLTWTIESNCLPQPSSGQLDLYLTDTGTGNQIHLQYKPLSFAGFTIDGVSGQGTTIAGSLAAGDKITLEMGGASFRAYKNGVLLHTMTPASGLRYPATFWGELTTLVVGSTPRLLAPELAGNWQIRSSGLTWAISPSHGTLTAVSGEPKVDYSNPSVPGEYTLTGQIESSAYQQAQALIVIPPLAIAGPLAVTLQPGAEARFKTNYDKAQNKIVAWTAVGGGSFDASDLYTAPTIQGVYTARASYSTQQADIAVTIPSVIFFDGAVVTQPLYLEAGKQYTLTHNLGVGGTTTWTGTGIGTTISTSLPYTAPGVPGTRGFVQAVRSGVTVRYEFVTLDVFPFKVNLPHKGTRKKAVLLSVSEGQTVAGRVKSKNGLGNDEHEITIRNIDNPEFLQIRAFWDEFFPHKRFILVDPIRNINLAVRIDSELSYQANAVNGCNIDVSFRVTEK